MVQNIYGLITSACIINTIIMREAWAPDNAKDTSTSFEKYIYAYIYTSKFTHILLCSERNVLHFKRFAHCWENEAAIVCPNKLGIQWLQWEKWVLGGLSCSPVKRAEIGTYLAPVLILNIYFLEVIQGNWNSEKIRITLYLPFCPVLQERNLAFSLKVSLHSAWALGYTSSLHSHQTNKNKKLITKYMLKLKSTNKARTSTLYLAMDWLLWESCRGKYMISAK